MPLPTKWNKKIKQPPEGFDYVEIVLEALENELRDKVKETDEKVRKNEAMWPVHQINWQKTRYIYDLYYTYQRISKKVYQYCLDQKLVDAALIAKWKKPGYERLCSTYVINPSNYKFGTVSICRVPWYDRGNDQKHVRDPTTGCLGCASGKGAGPRNIFGNKYGQRLAAVQIARERHQQAKEEEEVQRRKRQQDAESGSESDDEKNDNNGDESTDDEDYGPTPSAGIWAGSQKLQKESEKLEDDPDGEDVTDDEDDSVGPAPPKKVRLDESCATGC